MKKSDNINKITIVGGGTAGWMSAATLIKFFPEKEITLIESPDFPIIGVGESTLGQINGWLKVLEIKDEDFMKDCDATYKMSIKFNDFYDKGAGGFHYPFGLPYIEQNNWGIWDWHLMKYKYKETPAEDYAQSYFPASALYETNKISKNEDKLYDNYDFEWDTAYHFDAVKFGQWLKNNYCLPKGVKHILSTIENVEVDEEGIKSLKLDNGDIITSDLFIDCSGFKSMLLGEALKEPFKKIDHMLFNNRAWAAPIQYIDKDKEMQPYTNCTAIENGWCWNTPLYSRLGTGYVYSDKYVTPEEALEQFKQYLMSDHMAVPRTREQVDALKFRDVRMKTGIHERLWVKNTVAIGLSAGFIEPLESNGLYSVHEFLLKLVRVLLLPRINQFDKDIFNTACNGMFTNFSEFVAIHYALSHRNDTKYWQDIQKNMFSKKMVYLEPDRAVGFFDFQDIFMFKTEYSELRAGIHCIATGLQYPMVDELIYKQKSLQFPEQNYDAIATNIKASFLNKKNRWARAAKSEPTMYEYLKKNIYKD